MSDQIRDTNLLELLSQQEKTARYLQLLKGAKLAVKRRELNDKQVTVFFLRVCILQLKKNSSYCLTSNNPGIVEQNYSKAFIKKNDGPFVLKGLCNTDFKRTKNFSLNI